MTPEQLKRLADLEYRLTDVALNDADPENWTANGITLAEMTSEQRGDAAWCRKTAVQTVALLIRIQQLAQPVASRAPVNPEQSEESLIKKAEREAAALMERHAKAR